MLPRSEYKKLDGQLTPLSSYKERGLTLRQELSIKGRLQGRYQYQGLEFGAALGKPLFTDRNTENNQGVWLWKDQVTGFYYCFYSDCWKKNPFKGGAIECSAPLNTSLRIIADGAGRFLELLKQLSGFIPDEEEMQARIKFCDELEAMDQELQKR